MYHEGKEVAVHADIEDEGQTIIIRRKGGLGSLDPGDYELRPASTPKGYKAAHGVKFSVTSLEISGGDQEIRTSEGKKIVAGENEVLIAGKFSPDIELIAGHEIRQVFLCGFV